MKDQDDLIRKHSEELNQVKSKLASYTKKEGGNLMVRDFTDDIYTKPCNPEFFVESHDSKMFANLLVVVGKGKEE